VQEQEGRSFAEGQEFDPAVTDVDLLPLRPQPRVTQLSEGDGGHKTVIGSRSRDLQA
jgi:hypothetical protein